MRVKAKRRESRSEQKKPSDCGVGFDPCGRKGEQMGRKRLRLWCRYKKV